GDGDEAGGASARPRWSRSPRTSDAAPGRGHRRNRFIERCRGDRGRSRRRGGRLERGCRGRSGLCDARARRSGPNRQGRGVSDQPRTGKATAELFEQVILRRLGASDADVLVGPRHGVDVGVVRVAPGIVMALTADPVFVVPAYGWERAAWFAVHILASDASTSGLPLRWMTVDLNLPPEITDEELTALWDAYSRACDDLGIAIVTGHTARYDGCAWPMVGGATCAAVG